MRASSCARLALCPGSHRAEDGLPDTTSPEAERGQRIHAWLAEQAVDKLHMVTLDADEQAVADDLWAKTVKAGAMDTSQEFDVQVEAEMAWQSWTGHPDLIVRHCDLSVIVDDKTGWADIPDPESNGQLRVYAVMESDANPDNVIRCHIIKPGRCPEPVTYTPDDLADAKVELLDIAKAALAPDAPRIPGTAQCQFCRALGHPDRCPESCKLPAQVAAVMPTVEASLAVMPQSNLDTLAMQIQLVAKIGVKVLEELKIRLENTPECSDMFKLGKPTSRRELTDIKEAFCRLPDVVFFAGASLSLGDAAKELAAHTGCKVKDGPAKLAALLAGLIVDKPIARKLERK